MFTLLSIDPGQKLSNKKKKNNNKVVHKFVQAKQSFSIKKKNIPLISHAKWLFQDNCQEISMISTEISSNGCPTTL